MISVERARALTRKFARQRILVVGDVMMDRYIYGSVERISPEAPVPVVRVAKVREMAGGAANVAVNIRALGGEVLLGGVIGTDTAGDELVHVLRSQGIPDKGLVRVDGIPTTVKMRVVAERQQIVRVDWETVPSLPEKQVARFCRTIVRLVEDATAVVIEDYSKGIVRQEVVDAVLSAARRKGIPVGLDPKDNTSLEFAGITVATPNCREAFACAGLPVRTVVQGNPLDDRELRRAADILLEKWRMQQLIITLGPQGMYLAAPGVAPKVIPTRAREVYDVSGAGDTVIAACMLALSAGARGEESASLGNFAAGVVVGKLGTASCSRQELLASVANYEN